MHGWYSKKQLYVLKCLNDSKPKEERTHPIKRYNTPTGEIVKVTMVSQTLDHQATFDDIKYIGEVTEYINYGHS